MVLYTEQNYEGFKEGFLDGSTSLIVNGEYATGATDIMLEYDIGQHDKITEYVTGINYGNYDIINDIKKYIDENNIQNHLFLFSASALSETTQGTSNSSDFPSPSQLFSFTLKAKVPPEVPMPAPAPISPVGCSSTEMSIIFKFFLLPS